MKAAIERKPALFRLSTELLDILKQLAAKSNRSLNNYVETILIDAVYHTPNAETRKAMTESRNDTNLTTVDMDNFDSFLSSLDAK